MNHFVSIFCCQLRFNTNAWIEVARCDRLISYNTINIVEDLHLVRYFLLFVLFFFEFFSPCSHKIDFWSKKKREGYFFFEAINIIVLNVELNVEEDIRWVSIGMLSKICVRFCSALGSLTDRTYYLLSIVPCSMWPFSLFFVQLLHMPFQLCFYRVSVIFSVCTFFVCIKRSY